MKGGAAPAKPPAKPPTPVGPPAKPRTPGPPEPELDDAAKAAVCGLFHPVPHPYYDSQIRQQGFVEAADMLADLMPKGNTSEAMKLMPEEIIDTMTSKL